jgi:hypothetical protein
MVAFMEFVQSQSDLFANEESADAWKKVIGILTSGKQMIIRGRVHEDNRQVYLLQPGATLPSGKAALTKFGSLL